MNSVEKTEFNAHGLLEAKNETIALWAAPVRLKISEWAERYAQIPKRGNAEPGKYRLDRIPYQRDMLDDAIDPTVRESAWMIASQLGKTLCILFVTEFYIHHEPSSLLVVYPTLGDAESWSKNKFEPMRKATPAVAELIKDSKSRDSENTILEKSFPGGELTIAGANSPSTLRQKSKRVIILDEIDGYKPNAEGDPIEQADKRAETFFNAVKIKSSTPTFKRQSRIEDVFEVSDKQFWFCKCPRCGFEQTLKWCQVKWPKEQPELAWYECESCKAELSDQDRIKMIQDGQWKATAPFNGVRGRHMSGLYRIIGKKRAYLNYLHEFVDGFLKAKRKGREAMIVWTNTFLAETFEDLVERQDAGSFLQRLEDYGPELPSGVLCLIASSDVQSDRVEVQVVGFGLHEEAWGICHKTFYGNPHTPAVWSEVAKFLVQPFAHAIGKRMQIACCMIDSGGQSGRAGFAKPVYSFVGPRQNRPPGIGIFACKGSQSLGGQIRREARQKNGIVLQHIGTDEIKSLLFSRFAIKEPGPRFVHFHNRGDFGEEYFMQLTAEELQFTKSKGFLKRNWVKIRARNEALDLWVMAIAGLDKLNPDWRKLASIYGENAKQPEKPEEKPEPRKELVLEYIKKEAPKEPEQPKPSIRKVPKRRFSPFGRM